MKLLLPLALGGLLLSEASAAAQMVQNYPCPNPTASTTEPRIGGAKLSIDRGSGKAKIEIQCSASNIRQCVEAALPVLDEGQGGTVVYATSSIKCGNTIYEVSTGNNSGNCSVAGPEGGPRESVGCNDAPTGGNTASANCTTGCGATTGSGSCTIKSQ
jgi:hypothetical protein